ncbi:DUF6232 family protein [Promicromonospora sukumoe]|uniref:DUF6232 family protein n=1 Tax=Promicromonospora sukumoe TaxID=88382 RepID=UPI0003805398|nr:DUF6232 family protein [Promicromonospora sukumoe]
MSQGDKPPQDLTVQVADGLLWVGGSSYSVQHIEGMESWWKRPARSRNRFARLLARLSILIGVAFLVAGRSGTDLTTGLTPAGIGVLGCVMIGAGVLVYVLGRLRSRKIWHELHIRMGGRVAIVLSSWTREPLDRIQEDANRAQRDATYRGPLIHLGSNNAINIGGEGNSASTNHW